MNLDDLMHLQRSLEWLGRELDSSMLHSPNVFSLHPHVTHFPL
ncbi:MAG TPA: hypothetical protein V6C78_33110 [Crinalium sp.]